MRGYFFSLETLIAITILLSSIFIIHISPLEINDKEDKIYAGMNILEEENKLRAKSEALIKFELEKVLDFDVEINKNCEGGIVDYLIVEGTDRFKIIRVCY